MERIIYNGGIDIKEYKKLSDKQYTEMERMLQKKIKEFSKEIEEKYKIKTLDVDMPCIGFVNSDE